MRNSRRLLTLGLISLVLAGITSDQPIVGLFIALAILGIVGSFNAAIRGRDES